MPLPKLLSASESAAIRDFVSAVRALPGLDLKDARLFGSRARGDGHEGSDLDVALIVGAGGRARRHSIYDLAFDIGVAHYATGAVFTADEAADMIADAEAFLTEARRLVETGEP